MKSGHALFRRFSVRRLALGLFLIVLMLVLGRSAGRFLTPGNQLMEGGQNPVIISQLGFPLTGALKLIKMRLMPFTGYHAAINLTEEGEFRGVHYKLKTNSLGFLTPYEFDSLKEPPFKGHGKTKVVLVTGGSAAWGIGASANEKIFANALERILQNQDPEHDWKVVNLAMAAWNAYQEFIALDMYGANFNPDWVVTFDGRNDIAVGTLHGEPVPGYYFFSAQKKLNDIFEISYDEPWYYGLLPVFRYRRFLNQLMKVTDIPTENTNWDNVLATLRFYYHSLNSIVRRFPDSKILLVTQPSLYALENVKAPGFNPLSSYVAPAYSELISTVGRMTKTRPGIKYLNAGNLFKPESWSTYLVDDCHLNDAGHAVVAASLATIILGK